MYALSEFRLQTVHFSNKQKEYCLTFYRLIILHENISSIYMVCICGKWTSRPIWGTKLQKNNLYFCRHNSTHWFHAGPEWYLEGAHVAGYDLTRNIQRSNLDLHWRAITQLFTAFYEYKELELTQARLSVNDETFCLLFKQDHKYTWSRHISK